MTSIHDMTKEPHDFRAEEDFKLWEDLVNSPEFKAELVKVHLKHKEKSMEKQEVIKELRDQALHFGIGMIITLLLAKLMPAIIAGIFVLFGAWTREVWQRLQKGKPWNECKSGCQIDLVFWALGALTGGFIGILVWS